MTTNVPLPHVTDAGIQLPTVADIKDGAWQDMLAATNNQAVRTDASVQGQIVNTQAALASSVNAKVAYVAAQFDPDTAQGEFLDAYGVLYGVARKSALPTVVNGVVMSGSPYTPVPAGAIAEDIYGNRYQLVDQVAFDASGNASGVFECTVTGPVQCPANALNKIGTGVAGWQTVNNPIAGVPGRAVESQTAYRQRQRDSLYIGGRGSIESLRAAVADINAVRYWFVWHNTSDNPITYGSTNYTLAPHSVVVSVEGGADVDVANAMLAKMSDSAGMNGNTTVSVVDTAYNPPAPTYAFTFLRPAALQLYMSVNVLNIGTLPPDYVAQVKNIILSTFSGSVDGVQENIGQTVYVSKYYSACFPLQPAIYVQSIAVGITSTPTGSAQAIGIDQYPVLQAANIAVNLVSP